jgi:hypothetical protein
MRNKPYGIYMSTDKAGIWMRVKSFNNMDSALHSLKDLTRTSKKKRNHVYTILPNEGSKRFIGIKEEYIEQVLNSAR